MTTINPHPQLLRYLSQPPRLPTESERLIIELLPPYQPQCSAEPKRKPYPIPDMRPARFRVPTESSISAQDGTQVRCDTGRKAFVDDHGNSVPMGEITSVRPWHRARKKIIASFGVA